MKRQLLPLGLSVLVLAGGLAAQAMAQSASLPGVAGTASPIAGDADLGSGGLARTHVDGKAVYDTICAACHMADGMGAQEVGFYPALAGNPRLRPAGYSVYVIMNGMHGMPPLGDLMSDDQVAEVVNYIRTSWGNDFPGTVSPAEVSVFR